MRNTVIPKELMMEEGVALTRYGMGEYGRLVRIGKYQTQPPRFDDKLVDACAKMLLELKKGSTNFTIVPIPSLRNNELVSDFAFRLARRLGVGFSNCLTKIQDTSPQKNMENSVYQQKNIINAFSVLGHVPKGACVLVDDMVDSKWTFTVAAAVLREAGAALVVPLALADSSDEGD